jgi:hypothetical protein
MVFNDLHLMFRLLPVLDFPAGEAKAAIWRIGRPTVLADMHPDFQDDFRGEQDGMS